MPEDWRDDGTVVLSADVCHHLMDVLRIQVGEHIVLFDGQGREARADITAITRRVPLIKIISSEVHEKSPLQLILVQAIAKGKRMDLVMEKATEIGATEIWPVLSERVVVRLNDKQQRERQERWQRVVVGAARQCGTPWMPHVQAVTDVTEMGGTLKGYDCVLLAAVDAGGDHLGDVVSRSWDAGARRMALLIGPEGDWTVEEQALMRGWGAKPVSLGERVLRAETAALFGLSVIVSTCR
ncbi:MAG: 16S rRNA (uracil(1498)-N(3))-methyltransferase [Kiritimatiellae bacterium]|nr:16S rRNA (uracil(1498)-N(3))-methyltransferase [Kiritimatiellia bacterium]